MVIYLRQGASYVVNNDRFWKGNYDFLQVVYSNFDFLTHRFIDNAIFLQTGNNVIVISPLGGTVYGY
jgi:hypothetical protein